MTLRMEPIIRPRLGLALRHLMLDKGVTARDLARSLGIGETRLSRMLRGELEVSPAFAEAMLVALHRRHLIAGAGDSPPALSLRDRADSHDTHRAYQRTDDRSPAR